MPSGHRPLRCALRTFGIERRVYHDPPPPPPPPSPLDRVAVKEFDLSYHIGATLLLTIYTHYGNLILSSSTATQSMLGTAPTQYQLDNNENMIIDRPYNDPYYTLFMGGGRTQYAFHVCGHLRCVAGTLNPIIIPKPIGRSKQTFQIRLQSAGTSLQRCTLSCAKGPRTQ